MEKMPELMRLLRTKSTMRYFPPKGTAGLERSRVRGNKRLPLPPARTNATILRRILTSSLDLSRSECRRGCTTQHSKHMVEGFLRTNSGFMHDVDTIRSQLTDPETVISLGDRDVDLGRTHAASDLMRQIKCFDCPEVREGSDAHPDRREAPRSSL